MSDQQERRHTSGGGKVQVRKKTGTSKGHVITGYAAVFSTPTDIGGQFTEEIEPGAFRDALATSDIRALFNHNADHLLGRLGSGTLRAREDTNGLFYELDVPNTRLGEDLVELVNRGDLTGNSFSFVVDEDGERWDRGSGKVHRVITRFREVLDLGPVTWPAYKATTVSARAQARAKETPPKRPDLRAAHARRRKQLRDALKGSPSEEHAKRRRQLQELRGEPGGTPRKQPTPAQLFMAARRRDPAEVERVGYHESGHCVLSVMEGSGVELVLLEGKEDGGVVGGFYSRRDVSTEVLAGGLAAERVNGGGSQGWAAGARGDYRALEVMYRKQCLNAKGYAWNDLERAEHRLREAWPAVRALASALAQKGALKGKEAEAVVMGALPASLRSQAALRTQNAEGMERALAMARKNRAA